MKQSFFDKWYDNVGYKTVEREVAQVAFNQLQEQVAEETRRERNCYKKALKKIRLLNPADTEEGYNEWGEALCFNRAQEIANEALETGGNQPAAPTIT